VVTSFVCSVWDNFERLLLEKVGDLNSNLEAIMFFGFSSKFRIASKFEREEFLPNLEASVCNVVSLF